MNNKAYRNGELFTMTDEEQAEWEAQQPTEEDIALEASKKAQEAINKEALDYLASTDWMLIRELDGGVAMKDEVKALRAEARLKVV